MTSVEAWKGASVEDGASYPFELPVTVSFRDLDSLGHVNNAVYLTYFEHARVAYGLRLVGGRGLSDISFIMAEATVTYLKPAHYGDELLIGVRVGEIGTKSFVMDYRISRPRTADIVARGRTVQVWFDYAAQRSVPVPPDFRAAVARDNAGSNAGAA